MQGTRGLVTGATASAPCVPLWYIDVALLCDGGFQADGLEASLSLPTPPSSAQRTLPVLQHPSSGSSSSSSGMAASSWHCLCMSLPALAEPAGFPVPQPQRQPGQRRVWLTWGEQRGGWSTHFRGVWWGLNPTTCLLSVTTSKFESL